MSGGVDPQSGTEHPKNIWQRPGLFRRAFRERHLIEGDKRGSIPVSVPELRS